MFDINGFDLLVRSLHHRNFIVNTSFDAYDSSFEAIRSFPNGDYYLFTLSFGANTPLSLEIYQDGNHSTAEFTALTSIVDVKKVIMFCEEIRFPYAW